MPHEEIRFGPFRIDRADRSLHGPDGRIDLPGRYFDVLLLLVDAQGQLVTKDRFLAEAWRGVPVTDEALTQGIRTLRRALGDEATTPRFIETVPKHGYRFIAALADAPPAATSPVSPRPSLLPPAAAMAVGGALAGLVGGIAYGVAAAAPGVGAVSALVVLATVTALVGLLGGFGVGLGIAAADRAAGAPGPARIVGGLGGGLLVGGLVNLVGADAFQLLLGQQPGRITGAFEGALLGSAVGLAAWLATRSAASPRRAAAMAGLLGALAGAAAVLMGGQLLAGSLEELATAFPASRLRLPDFGPVSTPVAAMLEAGLFSACAVAALVRTRR